MMVRTFFILLLALFHVTMIDFLYNNPTYYQLDAYTWETDEFRSMNLGPLLAESTDLDYDQVAALMVEHDFDLTEVSQLRVSAAKVQSAKPAAFKKLSHAYQMVLEDLKYFPVPENTDPSCPEVSYANGWQDKRTYGGERGHEGCDIMGTEKPRGYYPVVSMSDGVVKKVGWLEQGGWRLGIRAPGGAYLYYAHLYGYSRQWKEGDEIKAGQLLGFMGDTGYSAVEGTTGNFDVHLHVGIYLKTDHMEEMSVNPYWILKYLEKYKLEYQY